MKIENLEEVIGQLKPKLHDYLRLHNIEPTKLFSCINPQHEDKKPSCSATGGDFTLFRCCSCGCAGDIFHAAHHLENKPLVGEEFIRENVAYLAGKFEIEVKEVPLTEEEVYRIETYRAYASAASLISTNNISETIQTELERRKWSNEICNIYGVGSIPSFKSFRSSLKSLGFSASFLKDVDLGRDNLFSDQNLTFTIRDPQGRPVGFSSRTFAGGDVPKYNNQKTTGLKCNIYKKTTRLFGLDIYLKQRKKNEYVYIFEGYSDVVTAAQAGLPNCVAIGSSDLSVEQLQVLKDNNIYKLCLVLDGDKTGREKTAKALDTILSGHKDLSVKVIVLPDGTDPDDLIRDKGITTFRKLKKWSAFEWRLNEFPSDMDDEEVCRAMVPLIVNESSHITQDKLCKVLATRTGIDLRVIKLEVERLQNSREAEKARVRDNIINKLVTNLQRHPQEAEQLVFNADGELRDAAKQYEEDTMCEDYQISVIARQKEAEEARTVDNAGLLLGEDLREIERIFRTGEWNDTWWVFAADEQCGKTALMLKLGLSAIQNPDNNAMVVVHTIDDTREQLLPRCVTILAGNKSVAINQVVNPSLYKDKGGYESLIQLREDGYSKLLDLSRDGRFVIRDTNDGNTLAYADRLIKYYRNKYPDRRIIYVLDNFHKLNEFGNSQSDDRMKYKRMSEATKRLATSNHCTVMSTVEYKKGSNPTVIKNRGNEDIAETKGIGYDGSVIIHMYNDVHVNGDQAKFFHICKDPDNNEVKMMPIVRLNIKKNKVSGFEGVAYLKFHPSSSDWSFADTTIIDETPEEEDQDGSWGPFQGRRDK